MKKLTLLFVFACLAYAGAMAKSVVFTLVDGTKVYYLLGGQTNPKLRFVEGKMTVDADVYEFSDIKKFYISEEDDPNAIEDVLTEKEISFRSNVLIVKAGNAGAVRVYTAAGVRVNANVVASDGIVTVDLNGLKEGAYVISVGKSSFKVLKK